MIAGIKKYLPIFEWLPTYSKPDAVKDLVAAAIVTIMLVPQSLAYAMLAGLPAHIGLYASILPLVVYAIFGTSRTLAVGPVAVVSLMTAAALGKVAATGSQEYLAAAVVLALMSGLVLVIMGLLRLGFIANFLSHQVISGFITSSGILIAISQLKHILGVKSEGDTLPGMLHSMGTNLSHINPYTFAIGVLSMTFLFWVRKQLKPLLVSFGIKATTADLLAKAGPVLVIVFSVLAVIGFDLAAKGVKLVGVIPSGMPPFTVPVFDYKLWSSLLPAAVLISLVGFVESISIAQTLAAKRRQRIVPNQELVGLGVSNVAAAMSGGFPVTGGFARSVVNYDAGAETPLAGAFTAVGILVATLFLTSLFQYLPQAVLAATIVVAVLSLVDMGAILRTYTYSKMDFASMLATIVCVLLVGVETGILVGVSLSLLLFLWRTSQPHVAIVGLVPGTEHFRNVDRHDVITQPSLLTLRIDESLYFANAGYLEDKIYELVAAKPEVKNVILMCSGINMIDASALESLSAISHRLNSSGVNFHLSEVKGPVMDSLQKSDFFRHFKGRVFLTQFEGINFLTAAKFKL